MSEENKKDAEPATGTITLTDEDGNPITIGDGSTITTADWTWKTSDSTIITSTPSGGNWITDYIGAPGFYPVKEKCSKCKQVEEVHTTYNWSDDDKLKRTICKKCHAATMDKMYGLDNNIKAEEALYGKKDK